MSEEPTILSGKTLVPLTVIVSLAGGIVWLSVMFFNTTANTQNIKRLELRIDSLEDTNSALLDRTARIETKLDILIEKAE